MSPISKGNAGVPRAARPVLQENVENLPMMMTRDEVARAFQVTTKTVDNMWRQGKLPRPSRIGRGIRFMRSDILRFIEETKA